MDSPSIPTWVWTYVICLFQIVWDEDKKQWVNKDGTEDTSSVAAPPPKDFELSGGGGLKPPGSLTEKRNSMPVAPPGPGTDSAGNVFQRRKGPLGMQGSHSLEKYLNIQDCLEKSLKIKFVLKVALKSP